VKASFASLPAVVQHIPQMRGRAIVLGLLLTACGPLLLLAEGLPLSPAGMLAAVEDDPLPAKAPDRFNPDPGGRRARSTVRPPTDNQPVVPDLFAPVIPLASLEDQVEFGSEKLPYRLRLPRRNLTADQEFIEDLPYPTFPMSQGGVGLLPNAIPQINRWEIPFGQLSRYPDRHMAETPYLDGPLRLFDPYKASLLKGDSPIIGKDIFLSILVQDQIEVEFRRTPVGSAISSARSNSNEFFGRSESYTLLNNLSMTIELFKGETAFKPIQWAIHLTPVFNINYNEFKETGIVSPDPRGPNYPANNPNPRPPLTIANPGDIDRLIGDDFHRLAGKDLGGTRYTQRTRETVVLQEAFAEIHIRDLSDTYDFASSRIGSQLFVSDFRGFIFNDTDPGIRIFGNYDNNRIQYNAAYFNIREKDTFSGLNQYSARGQDVFILNLFRQDFLSLFLPKTDVLAQGYTAQLSFHANLDHGEQHYDKTGVIVRPAPIGGPIDEHDVNAFYLGWAGDGHIGWLNITHAFYEVLGHDDLNGISGRGVDINAQMFALELSRDYDYLRPHFTFFYASGDDDVRDNVGRGFDAIYDNPTLAGAPFSFFTRQGFGLANAAVLAKAPNSLLLDLRTQKTEGQSNFVNPGTLLVGVGLDADLTPKLKMQFNANYIRFVDTDAIKEALFANQVDRELGWDINLGFTYRPTLTQNIVINAGFGAFLPGRGYRDIYRENTNPVPGFTMDPKGEIDSFLYSGLIAITLRY
jgi:hypothetical protein